MALHSPKKYPVKIIPINIEGPRGILDIESQRSNETLILKNKRKMLCEKYLKILYASLIISIVQYGVGIVIFILFVPKSHQLYTINEVTWIPYLLGFCCIHIPVSLCVCRLEPNVNGCCGYFRYLAVEFTK